jgi:hypothetical protein
MRNITPISIVVAVTLSHIEVGLEYDHAGRKCIFGKTEERALHPRTFHPYSSLRVVMGRSSSRKE